MHEGPSRIGHLFELVRSGTQHHLLGCSSGLIAVAPRNEGRLDSRNSGPGETSPGEQPESFPKWLLRHRHVSRGGLPAARLLQSGEALRPPPNPLPQPSKRFARREGFPGSQGNHRADSPPVAKPARKLFQTKVRLQTASPHAPVAPLPTPTPLDTREVDVSALA